MKDPYGATDEEIRQWAAGSGQFLPVQDWDVILIHTGRSELLLELAADPDGPHRDFFLGCLDTLVDDCLPTHPSAVPRSEIDRLLARAHTIADPVIESWAGRLRDELTRSGPPPGDGTDAAPTTG